MNQNNKRIFTFATAVLFCLLMANVSGQTKPAKPAYENIVTRQGDKLMDGNKEFRFMGLAAPNIQQNESQRHSRTNKQSKRKQHAS